MNRIILLISLFFVTTVSIAQQYSQYPVTIGTLGSHSGQVFYMNLREGFSTDCAWGLLYCSTENENCKNYLSILLTAKSMGKQIDIRYSQAGAGQMCTVDLVSIN